MFLSIKIKKAFYIVGVCLHVVVTFFHLNTLDKYAKRKIT